MSPLDNRLSTQVKGRGKCPGSHTSSSAPATRKTTGIHAGSVLAMCGVAAMCRPGALADGRATTPTREDESSKQEQQPYRTHSDEHRLGEVARLDRGELAGLAGSPAGH